MIKPNITLHDVPFAIRYEVLIVDGQPDIEIDRVRQEDGSYKWAVRWKSSWCLSSDGKWDYESRSDRPDDWIDTHRFNDFEVAWSKARAAALVTIEGYKKRARLLNENEAKRLEDAGS